MTTYVAVLCYVSLQYSIFFTSAHLKDGTGGIMLSGYLSICACVRAFSVLVPFQNEHRNMVQQKRRR